MVIRLPIEAGLGTPFYPVEGSRGGLSSSSRAAGNVSLSSVKLSQFRVRSPEYRMTEQSHANNESPYDIFKGVETTNETETRRVAFRQRQRLLLAVARIYLLSSEPGILETAE